ncbi:MAG: NAD(P)-dependent alcohol dehydrogenase [Thermoanaerobaculia bacterium]
MRAVELRSFGLDHLAIVERPDPAPGPGQALVRLRAASLNYRDLLTIEGKYNPKLKLPLIPCSDGAGEVVAIGDGVTRVRPGDRVCGNFAQHWIAGEPRRERMRTTLGGPLDGTLAELAVYDQEGLVKFPEHLTDEEAATLPCAAVTAWTCLHGLTAGETVLLQGTGGVSIFALQLARLRGARGIITSSSDDKLARARELGGGPSGPEILGINYREVPDWGAKAKELAGGAGVDLVVEVGGAGTLKESLRAVRMGGTIALIGNLAGNTLELPLPLIFMQNVRVQGVLVGPRDSFEAMNRAIALHHLRPVIDRVFPLADIRAAFDHMAAGGHFGKICINLG